MARVIEFQGRRIEVPDNATDADVQGILAQSATPVPPGEPSAITDVPASFGSGIVRGAVETAMLPVTAKRLMESGVGYAYDKGEDLIRSIIGADAVTPEQRSQRDHLRDDSAFNIDKHIYSGQDSTRGVMDEYLYEPKTTAGKYAETVGEFVAPGGTPSRAVRAAPGIGRKAIEYSADMLRNAVVPGVASEAAGQLTEGTAYEAPARVVGALAGNVGSAVARASNAPETVLRRAVGPADDIDWEAAIGLQNNPTGVRLTGPEAITQVQNGASALPNLQRVIEGSMEGRSVTAPFFAARPGQVDSAVGNVLDQIAPQSNIPSSLGPRAAQAADSALNGVRQDINTQTRPLYEAAEPQTIPDAQFAPIQADPRFQSGLARLRGNADLAPDYAGMPDNSIAVVDAVTKDMAARGEAMANSANPLYGPELASRNSAGAANARDIARAEVPAYDEALTQQAQQRRDVLQPLEEGPLGKVAAAKDTAGAGNAILPRDPLTGSQDETADAVTRLVGQDADTTRGLVRQNLGDRYSKASTETQEGSREFAGAKFHKDVAGNEQRDATLEAVLGALGVPEAAAAMPQLLEVLQATGRRKPIGSATEFNRSLNADLGTGSPAARAIGVVKSLGTSVITNATDAVKRAALRNNTGDLANMFIDPRSVELIREAINRSAPIGLREASGRTAAQVSPIAEQRSE